MQRFLTSFIFLSALMASQSLWAADFNGFYMGSSLGYIANSTDLDYGPGLGSGNSYSEDQKGIALVAGYSKTYNRYYLAGELGLNINPSGDSASDGGNRIKAYEEHSIRLSILPGFRLTPRLLTYARLGLGRGKYEAQSTNTASTSLMDDEPKVKEAYLGAGAQYAITSRWGVRLEGTHVAGQDTDTNNGGSISPSTNEGWLGFIYQP